MQLHRRVLLAALSCTPVALNAHHSVALNFSQEEIVLDGTITELRWVNPHCTFVLAVENEAGGTDEWLVEMLARIALERQGFDFDWLEEGMDIQLTGRRGLPGAEPAVRRGGAAGRGDRTGTRSDPRAVQKPIKRPPKFHNLRGRRVPTV